MATASRVRVVTQLEITQRSKVCFIVAIGGSRGVAAAVVKELAARYQPRLELVAGRDLPANIADLATLDRLGLKQLKGSRFRRTPSKSC